MDNNLAISIVQPQAGRDRKHHSEDQCIVKQTRPGSDMNEQNVPVEFHSETASVA